MATENIPLQLTAILSGIEDPRSIQLRNINPLAEFQNRDRTSVDLIETAHQLTKLSEVGITANLERFNLFQQDFMLPVQFGPERKYPLCPLKSLSPPPSPGIPFATVLRDRRSLRVFSGESIESANVSGLLYAAQGESGSFPRNSNNETPSLRVIPSAGALHPTEIYFVTIKVNGMPMGLFHYYPAQHSLEEIRPLTGNEDLAALFKMFPIHPHNVDLSRASIIIFVTSSFWRSRAKYGARGYRYCLLEAGFTCQNIGLMATALGLGHVLLGGFYDDPVNSWLGIDGVDEAVIASVAIGLSEQA